MTLKSDKVKKIEAGIRTIIEAEGLHCPKFFISTKGNMLMFHVHAYSDEPTKVWSDSLRKRYPEIADKVLGRWVTIGEAALEILGIDETISEHHVRAKDRHDNHWLIPSKELMEVHQN